MFLRNHTNKVQTETVCYLLRKLLHFYKRLAWTKVIFCKCYCNIYRSVSCVKWLKMPFKERYGSDRKTNHGKTPLCATHLGCHTISYATGSLCLYASETSDLYTSVNVSEQLSLLLICSMFGNIKVQQRGVSKLHKTIFLQWYTVKHLPLSFMLWTCWFGLETHIIPFNYLRGSWGGPAWCLAPFAFYYDYKRIYRYYIGTMHQNPMALYVRV